MIADSLFLLLAIEAEAPPTRAGQPGRFLGETAVYDYFGLRQGTPCTFFLIPVDSCVSHYKPSNIKA
jgi:hypothetical protein